MLLTIDKPNLPNIYKHPYEWIYFNNIFDEEVIKDLNFFFPSDNYELRESSRDDKSYKMFHKTLYDNRNNKIIVASDLKPLWSELINELISENYINYLSRLINIDLKEYDIEINCWKYEQGCWLSPHTDKVEKLVSQLFYFNEKWDASWGGSLRILNSSNIEDYHTEIFPGLGNSTILVRSDNSWHGVTTQEGPENISRKVLQLIFWKRSNTADTINRDDY